MNCKAQHAFNDVTLSKLGLASNAEDLDSLNRLEYATNFMFIKPYSYKALV
jgi:hypothetical protein